MKNLNLKSKNLSIVLNAVLISACLYPVPIWEYWFKVAFWIQLLFGAVTLSTLVLSKSIASLPARKFILFIGLILPSVCVLIVSVGNFLWLIFHSNIEFTVALRDFFQLFFTLFITCIQWLVNLLLSYLFNHIFRNFSGHKNTDS